MKTEKFKIYLESKGFQPRTIYGYVNKLNQFFMWCDDNNINADTASLEELYQYKKDSLSRNIADSSAQELIQVIKLYYQAIKRVENPTLLMKHRKRQVNLPNNLLSENDLKTFYQS